MNCIHCNREINNRGSLYAHQMSCSLNPEKITHARSPLAGRKKGSVAWNKGIQTGHKPWNKGLTGLTGTPHTEETKKHLSKRAKELNYGGYIPGSGRGKKGWYNGFFCDSSWELAYVIYCLEHNINIKRNTDKRKYIWEGVEKSYTPDFIVDGKVTEIKGYKTDQWLAKHKANPDIEVLYEKEMQPILNYVISKYGKNYIELYQGR